MNESKSKVTFVPNVVIYGFDDDYDRTSVECASLSREDIYYIIRLRSLMSKGQFITDNPEAPVEPSSLREHFNRFLEIFPVRSSNEPAMSAKREYKKRDTP